MIYLYFFVSKLFSKTKKRKEEHCQSIDYLVMNPNLCSKLKPIHIIVIQVVTREIYFRPKMNNSTAPLQHVTFQPSLGIIVVPSALNRYKLLITYSDDLLMYFNFPSRERVVVL